MQYTKGILRANGKWVYTLKSMRLPWRIGVTRVVNIKKGVTSHDRVGNGVE